MAENLPVRRGSDLVAIAQQTEQIQSLGATLIASGLLPDQIKKPETALAIMLKGDEIGIGTMHALSHIVVISGKPAMSAELMAALAQRAGHKIRVMESTPERCVVVGIRRDDPSHETRIEFSMDDARRANLAGKGSWKTYPVDLLRSRAISRLCRTSFPDAIAGMSYTPEELGAEVNEDGEVVGSPQPQVEDHGEPEVEDAEVVEEGPGDDGRHHSVLRDIDALIAVFPDGYFAEPEKIPQYARQDYEQAVASRKRLERLLGELEQNEAASDGTDEPGEEIDLDEDDITEVESVADGGTETSKAPARKSQVDLLKTLAVELRGEDGVAKLEERIGRPLEQLTRAEANTWIERLSPEEA